MNKIVDIWRTLLLNHLFTRHQVCICLSGQAYRYISGDNYVIMFERALQSKL